MATTWQRMLLVGLLVQHAVSVPTQAAQPERAIVTPAPVVPPAHQYPHERRQLASLTSKIESYVQSIVSGLGSDIPSYVTEGLLPGELSFPTGSAVLSSANVSSSDIAAQPTQVLNIPGYGNWSASGWDLRVHGNVFKQPVLSNATVDKLANKFLIGTSVADLPQDQQDQARNVTREIYVVQQDGVNVTVNIFSSPSFGGSGQPGGGGGVSPNISQQIQSTQLPYKTTPEGDFDVFIPVQNTSGALLSGSGDIPPQRLNVYTQGTDTGNATSYLVSNQGLTVISDIDDILRVTKIYQPKEGILNTFARPFTPWMDMPSIYANWSRSLPTMHFHYLTTTPEQATRNYMQYIYANYPGGSFDTRPLNFSDLSATLSIRKFLLEKIFRTYPNRKFILVADTSNSDVMRDYPAMATEFPGQVQCIFLRNTSSTDSGDKFPYNTAGFKNLNQQMYMFFNVPDDLTNLDIVNGQCYNASIKQNLTFGYQGLPFGLSTGSGNSTSSNSAGRAWWPSLGNVALLGAGSLLFNLL